MCFASSLTITEKLYAAISLKIKTPANAKIRA